MKRKNTQKKQHVLPKNRIERGRERKRKKKKVKKNNKKTEDNTKKEEEEKNGIRNERKTGKKERKLLGYSDSFQDESLRRYRHHH